MVGCAAVCRTEPTLSDESSTRDRGLVRNGPVRSDCDARTSVSQKRVIYET